MPHIIKRYGKPTIHDQAPFGTICISEQFTKEGIITLEYIQNSHDESIPHWDIK